MPLPATAVTRIRSVEAAAIAGVAYAILALLSLMMLNQTPSPAVGDAELTAWYDDGGNRTSALVALTLAAFSSIAFLWFVAVMRRRIGEREDQFFATVFLGSAMVYVAVWLVAASAITAPAVAVTLLDTSAVDASAMTLAYGQGAALLLVVLPRLQAVFVLASTTIVRRTGALQRWVTVFGYVVAAVLLLTPIVARSIGVVYPAWVFVVSIALLFGSPTDN